MKNKEQLEWLEILSSLEKVSIALQQFQETLMLLNSKELDTKSFRLLSIASERFRDELVGVSISLKDANFEINVLQPIHKDDEGSDLLSCTKQ